MGGSWAPATPHPSVPDDAGGPGAFGARASREPNPPMCPLRGEGQGPEGDPKPPSPLSTFALPPAGAHGVGAHAGRRPRLAQGSWPTTNEKGNGPARPGQGPLLAPTCGRLPAPTPGGRGASPSPPASAGLCLPPAGLSPGATLQAPQGVSAARPPRIYTQQRPADSGGAGGQDAGERKPPSRPGHPGGGRGKEESGGNSATGLRP